MLRRVPLRRLIEIFVVVAIVVVGVLAVFYWSWIDFRDHYLGIMRNLNSFETKAFMRSRINGTYDFTGLIEWTNDNLNWCDESFTRYSDPKRILEQGKGRCEEFAIVYVAACLACGYEARIVDPSPTPFWNDTSRYRS